jgi:hypothetical protein
MTRMGREWLLGGGYLVLLFIGIYFKLPTVWSIIFAATLAQAFLAWRAALARRNAVTHTPTSRIASAAQGYVELSGAGHTDGESVVYSPARHLPCLWYRYRAYERSGDDWRYTESGESDTVFVLEDVSGRCLIDPIGAEVQTTRKESVIQGDSRVDEELLLEGDQLYGLGEFVSLGGGHAQFNDRIELGDILADWKDDQEWLLRRFDFDKNGEIDTQEWQLARKAAERELDERKRERHSQPVTHMLRRPGHGRPYLIANFPPEKLEGRYRLAVWVHGLATYASLIGLALALQKTF